MWIRFMAFLATIIFIGVGAMLVLMLQIDLLSLDESLYFVKMAYTDFNVHFIVVGIGMGLFLLGIFNIYLAMRGARRKSFVRIKGPHGDIQIAHRTIDEIVERVKRDIGSINKVSTRIIPKGRKISLEVKLFLGSVRNVIDISQRVQERVKEDVESVLGITNIGTVKVVVKKITAEKEKSYEDILEEKKSSRGIELHR